MEDKTIATVNDIKITENDRNRILNSIDSKTASKLNSEEAKKALLENMINSELLHEYGEKIEIQNTPKFKEALQMFIKELSANLVLEKIKEEVTVEEEEILSFYNENKDKLKEEDIYTIKHILVNSEDEIKDIKSKLDCGVSFDEAVNSYSICKTKENSGLLGSFKYSTIPDALKKVIDGLTVSQYSNYFMTGLGYHIVKLEGVKIGQALEFNNVKEELKDELVKIKTNITLNEFINKLRSAATIIKY